MNVTVHIACSNVMAPLVTLVNVTCTFGGKQVRGTATECDVLQAEHLREKERQEDQRRREEFEPDRLRLALDRGCLGFIAVAFWYCVQCCVLSCSNMDLC